MYIRRILDVFEQLTEGSVKKPVNQYIAGGRKKKLNYVETKVKNAIDRVTVELAGKQSESATKLANEYKILKDITEDLKIKKDKFNEKATQYVLDYFDASDEIYTRVLSTVSLTLTVSKKTVEEQTIFDFDSFYNDILVLVPQLKKKLEILKEKYTVVEEKEKKPSLRVKLDNEEVEESVIFENVVTNFWSKIQDFGKRLLSAFRSWGKIYDRKLEAIETKYNINAQPGAGL
jgi:hypothetical protein